MKKQMKYYALWLSVICVVMFFFQILIPGFTNALILNSNAWTQPWRFISSIFLHGDVIHLIYNLFALILFGLILEKYLGSKRFIVIFLFTGIVANVVAVNVYPSSLGASGAIFGIIGALTAIKPFLFVWAFGLPMPLIVAAVLWLMGDILRTFIPSNVGTIAHLSGIFLGLLIGLFLKEKKKAVKKNNVKIHDAYIRRWEDSWM